MQPSIEGILVPIGNDVSIDGKVVSIEGTLYDYFGGPPHEGTGAVNGLTQEDVAFINATMRSFGSYFDGITVSALRASDSMEAWVFVDLDPRFFEGPYPLLRGLDPLPSSGVLTWCNTD